MHIRSSFATDRDNLNLSGKTPLGLFCEIKMARLQTTQKRRIEMPLTTDFKQPIQERFPATRRSAKLF